MYLVKVLSRVAIDSVSFLSKSNDVVAGHESKEHITWFDELNHALLNAQKALHDNRSITLPQSNDQLWIVRDNAAKKQLMEQLNALNETKMFIWQGF
jgi:hypothetical protein